MSTAPIKVVHTIRNNGTKTERIVTIKNWKKIMDAVGVETFYDFCGIFITNLKQLSGGKPVRWDWEMAKELGTITATDRSVAQHHLRNAMVLYLTSPANYKAPTELLNLIVEMNKLIYSTTPIDNPASV